MYTYPSLLKLFLIHPLLQRERESYIYMCVREREDENVRGYVCVREKERKDGN